MTIYVLPADKQGCGFYRLIWPARALASQGERIRVLLPDDPRASRMLRGITGEDGRVQAVSVPADATAIVMQRVTNRFLAEAIPLWRKQGIAIVIDFDDDLSAIDQHNPAWKGLHPGMGREDFSWHVAEEAAKAATWVTVSTPALAAVYGRHGRVSVLRNRVPRWYTKLDVPERPEAVGWGGNAATHPSDLQVMGSAVRGLVQDGQTFRVVGPWQGVGDALNLADLPWTASGGVKIGQWPHQLASDIGIGLAPLADTKFNAAKSWLKPLEYAALGIPCVMSPRAEYQAINRDHGIGLMAGDRARDWLRQIKYLSDPAAYADVSAAGRERVAEHLTIEDGAHEWLAAWLAAIQEERRSA